MADIDVKGVLQLTTSDLNGNYTMYVLRADGRAHQVEGMCIEMVKAIYRALGPSQEVDFSFTTVEDDPAEAGLQPE